jgi:uncharacterized protein YjiS (DUF1127 family)
MTSRSACQSTANRSAGLLPAWFSVRLGRWWQRGQAINELRALPDAQLRDIGIERNDVEGLIDRELGRFRSW